MNNSEKSTIPIIPSIKILFFCGSGAFGDVWVGEDVNGVKRAIKVIKKNKFDDNIGLNQEVEAIKLVRLDIPRHPNLVEIFHAGETEDLLYYIMELADNIGTENFYVADTLEVRLKKDALSISDIKSTIRLLLESLQHLHEIGFIHRDIKPSNIIFCRGIPKLADIGLITNNYELGQNFGTRYFLPFDKYTTGPQLDLYAIGKVLYCCLTRNHPHKFPELSQYFLEQSSEEYLRLNAISNKACHSDYKMRFKDANEFIAQIDSSKLRKKINIIIISIVIILLFVCTGVFIGNQSLEEVLLYKKDYVFSSVNKTDPTKNHLGKIINDNDSVTLDKYTLEEISLYEDAEKEMHEILQDLYLVDLLDRNVLESLLNNGYYYQALDFVDNYLPKDIDPILKKNIRSYINRILIEYRDANLADIDKSWKIKLYKDDIFKDNWIVFNGLLSEYNVYFYYPDFEKIGSINEKKLLSACELVKTYSFQQIKDYYIEPTKNLKHPLFTSEEIETISINYITALFHNCESDSRSIDIIHMIGKREYKKAIENMEIVIKKYPSYKKYIQPLKTYLERLVEKRSSLKSK